MLLCCLLRLASGGWDKNLIVWEVETGQILVRKSIHGRSRKPVKLEYHSFIMLLTKISILVECNP
jgi:hypothetical protein